METVTMQLPRIQTDPRYDNATLEKVIKLAGQLQSQHHESLTAQEIEAIGTEVGLEPVFVQQALAQLTQPQASPTPTRAAATLPRPTRRPKRSAVQRANLWTLAATFPLVWFIALTMRHSDPGTILVEIALLIGLGVVAGRAKAGFLASSGVSLLVMLVSLNIRMTLPLIPVLNIRMTLPLIPVLFIALFAGGMGALGGYLRNRIAPLSQEALEQTGTASVSRADLLQAFYSLQHQLQSQKQHCAFLSIDVVQSSQLKRSAPELAVEYSFGQLRTWLESIVAAHGGKMQMVAGDGMMCLFEVDNMALRAARQIQQQIGQFNQLHNRLPAPLQVRCGLSAGDVALEPNTPLGHLQSVVIDRAALIQKQAQPGSILVGPELTAPALVELGTLDPILDPLTGETLFRWQAGYVPTTQQNTGITIQPTGLQI